VRLGLYLDLRNPGESRPWPQVYARSIERVVEGERRGLGAVWTTEHHGAPDGYLPQPLTVLAALATRTTTLRLGTAVLLAPFRHPLAIAEEAAVVDILSDGRLELGLGAGWDPREFDAFGLDRPDRFRTLRDTVRTLPGLWADGRATPPPVQDPVPLWYGARAPLGARRAGELGTGLLWLDGDLLPPYRAGLEEGGHDPDSARMGGLANVFLCDDPERVRAEVLPHARKARAATYSGAQPAARPSALPRLEFQTAAEAAHGLAARIAGLPVTDVFMFDRIGGMGDDLADRHVELLTGTFRTEFDAALAGRAAASAG
jgi:alkanesulfonate monooxygenase SsuD/methylene tetrahydromethanopterin reductase-like flavin-dependent oxidoreductase (luciferase family)